MRHRFAAWRARHVGVVTLIVLMGLLAATALLVPYLQSRLEPHFVDEQRLSNLRAILLAIGGSLVGATAIAFSLVMFAMQVNVERMPHGTFRRLSSDGPLLGAFLGTFLLALAIAALSMSPDVPWTAIVVVGTDWATVLILLLFFFAYRRALRLINPGHQLALLVDSTRKEMHTWVRRPLRAKPLFDSPSSRTAAKPGSAPPHDVARLAFFQVNPHWTSGAQQAVLHAIAFARRFADRGDHEVSGLALDAVVAINRLYVEAKGRTFFTTNLLIDNPLVTDGFNQSNVGALEAKRSHRNLSRR